MPPLVTVVVLAYNEAENLPQAVGEIVAELKRLAIDWELLIVNDGSKDDTGALAENLAAAESRIRVIHHPENLGLGGGYRTGFGAARGQWVTFFPADCQFPARIISQFLAKKDEADLVLGYVNRREGLSERVLSAGERLLYRAFFGSFPRFQGIFLIRKEVLSSLTLHSRGRGWGIVMEMVLRAERQGFRLVSEKTEVRARLSGHSKVKNVRTILANFKQLIELRRVLSA
jgi:dolichol-phosphate mannosyltransferase